LTYEVTARTVRRVPEVIPSRPLAGQQTGSNLLAHSPATPPTRRTRGLGVFPRPAGSEAQLTSKENTMNWQNIESGWKNYKAGAKQQWSRLSDEQLDGTMGNRDMLSSRVQQAYGISKEETERQLTDWQSRQRDQQQPPHSVK
jgi:uncharacterized protein YjbJ (UPF0337 family)